MLNNKKRFITCVLSIFIVINFAFLLVYSNKKVEINIENNFFDAKVENANISYTLQPTNSIYQSYYVNMKQLKSIDIFLDGNQVNDGDVYIEYIIGKEVQHKQIIHISPNDRMVSFDIPTKKNFAYHDFKIKITNLSNNNLFFLAVEKPEISETQSSITPDILVVNYKGTIIKYHNTIIKILLFSISLLVVSLAVCLNSRVKKIVHNIKFSNKKTINKYKIPFIIEFILSFVFALLLLINIYEFNYYELTYINFLLALILGMILIFYIINLFITYRNCIEYLFLVIAIPIAILYMILIIPNAVPDEYFHFCKVYSVSNFDYSNTNVVRIPNDLQAVSLYKYHFYSNHLFSLGNLNNTYLTNYAAQYNFILYLIPSFGVIVGKLLNLSIFGCYILARLGNVLLFLLFGFLSIKKIPVAKTALFIFLLSPMMIQQCASVSADCLINLVSIYAICYFVYLKYSDSDINYKDIIVLCLCFIIILLAKYIYLVIFGLIFTIIPKVLRMNKKQLFTIVSFILFGIVLYFIFNFFVDQGVSTNHFTKYKELMHVDSALQISYLKTHISSIPRLFWHTFNQNSHFYLLSFLGASLANLTLNIDEFIIYLYLFLLISSFFIKNEENKYNYIERIWMILLVIIVIIASMFAMYIAFTPVGSGVILGVQGRYFIPIAFVVALVFFGKKRIIVSYVNELYFALLFIIHIIVLLDIICFFV